MKILFASTHCLIDPSSGAAIATRELLESLVDLGDDCRALCMGIFDYHHETKAEDVLSSLKSEVHVAVAEAASGAEVPIFDLILNGVRTTIVPTQSSRADRAPTHGESIAYLDLYEVILDRFQPDVVLTYGGHRIGIELMKRARKRNIPVVFQIHNFAYKDRQAFAFASHILVPSHFSRDYYKRTLALDAKAIDPPFRLDRAFVHEIERRPRYLTFVNPDPSKGFTVWARIAHELGHRRPDIPLLVVESRGKAFDLVQLDIDLSGHPNLHRMANTHDPRHFYRETRAILIPSLFLESFGLTAREALVNSIPVLASDRGVLPETLGSAGFTFPIPARYTPTTLSIPTREEINPWIETIERLWDDPAFEAQAREKAWEESLRWDPVALAKRYQEYFESIVHGR